MLCPGDYEDLSNSLLEAMCRLADDPVLREDLGKNARKTSEQFAKDRIIGQWKQLIQELLERQLSY